METGFKVGDVVQLRSGGTKMTIEYIADDEVACTWFEGKKLERAVFAPEVLIKYVRRPVGVIRKRRA